MSFFPDIDGAPKSRGNENDAIIIINNYRVHSYEYVCVFSTAVSAKQIAIWLWLHFLLFSIPLCHPFNRVKIFRNSFCCFTHRFICSPGLLSQANENVYLLWRGIEKNVNERKWTDRKIVWCEVSQSGIAYVLRVKKAVNNKQKNTEIRMLTDNLNTKTSDSGDMRRLWATKTKSST